MENFETPPEQLIDELLSARDASPELAKFIRSHDSLTLGCRKWHQYLADENNFKAFKDEKLKGAKAEVEAARSARVADGGSNRGRPTKPKQLEEISDRRLALDFAKIDCEEFIKSLPGIIDKLAKAYERAGKLPALGKRQRACFTQCVDLFEQAETELIKAEELYQQFCKTEDELREHLILKKRYAFNVAELLDRATLSSFIRQIKERLNIESTFEQRQAEAKLKAEAQAEKDNYVEQHRRAVQEYRNSPAGKQQWKQVKRWQEEIMRREKRNKDDEELLVSRQALKRELLKFYTDADEAAMIKEPRPEFWIGIPNVN